MADNQLYPVFSIPIVTNHKRGDIQTFKPCPLFDFDRGDFVTDGAGKVVMVDGLDSYILWVLKMLKTQEGACMCYYPLGIDAEGAMRENSREAVASVLERTITETLLCHPCTDRVYNFTFEWGSDSVVVSFICKPKNRTAFGVRMSVNA